MKGRWNHKRGGIKEEMPTAGHHFDLYR